MTTEQLWSGILAAFVAMIYLFLFLVIRWHLIVQANRRYIVSVIELTRADIPGDAHPTESRTLPPQPNLRCQAERLLHEAKELVTHVSIWDKVFGNRGQDLAAWVRIHKVRRLLVDVLPEEEIRARLVTIAEDLRDTRQPRAVLLADRIKKRLDLTEEVPSEAHASSHQHPPSTTGPVQPVAIHDAPAPHADQRADLLSTHAEPRTTSAAELKALLREACTIVFGHRDTAAEQEASSQSKTMLLMVTALLLIIMLAALQNAVLLLLGAVGGFVSRLSRGLRAELRPTDYSADWTGLFLSPLAGALAGWAGVLLLFSLADKNILRSPLFSLAWDQPFQPFTLAAAFLLGFSERFFDQITSLLQERTDQQPEKKPTQ